MPKSEKKEIKTTDDKIPDLAVENLNKTITDVTGLKLDPNAQKKIAEIMRKNFTPRLPKLRSDSNFIQKPKTQNLQDTFLNNPKAEQKAATMLLKERQAAKKTQGLGKPLPVILMGKKPLTTMDTNEKTSEEKADQLGEFEEQPDEYPTIQTDEPEQTIIDQTTEQEEFQPNSDSGSNVYTYTNTEKPEEKTTEMPTKLETLEEQMAAAKALPTPSSNFSDENEEAEFFEKEPQETEEIEEEMEEEENQAANQKRKNALAKIAKAKKIARLIIRIISLISSIISSSWCCIIFLIIIILVIILTIFYKVIESLS